MRVIKCDLCKKKIKEKPITAGVGILDQIELCKKCGAPILRFLKRHKFISVDKKSYEAEPRKIGVSSPEMLDTHNLPR